ncbi:MAG TPA: oxidoreductase [Steroidobacteraceae bacterium]|jgi:NAD(P)-dependent dehydrogenase (short-subunit alcohol dehydrogenase family)|nr:MAG: SDR family NAD(P)-dependent oxidoreductase [Betaproteobacteria bacterium]HWS67767.1 oxidoreductase [Steroidobacteraceae bacterium]
MQKTWFITGASRGLGAQIARAAIWAGDRVVAAGRQRRAIIDGLGPDSDQLLPVELDVTVADQARAAVDAAVSRFGAIDVLVNNAGYGHLGFFEETTIRDAQAQFATNLFGVFNVTWAVLPIMRSARNGRIFNISSLGGVLGAELASLYCASKFALEGFSESLSKEVAPFGLFVTIVEPGPFRTEFLTPESLRFADKVVTDYDDRRAQLRTFFERRNGQQPGDPAKLAGAIVHLASEAKPPMRFLAGSIAADAADAKLAVMRAELGSWRQLSVSTDGNYSA